MFKNKIFISMKNNVNKNYLIIESFENKKFLMVRILVTFNRYFQSK